MKTCPFCAEEIQDAAIVCKHCRRDLVPPKAATIACPFCGVLVARNSKVCPACGDDLSGIAQSSPVASQAQVAARREPTTTAKPSRGFLPLLVLVVLAFFAYNARNWLAPTPRQEPQSAAQPAPVPAPRTTPPAIRAQDPAAAESARAAVDKMVKLGLIKRMDIATGKFYIDGPLWEGFELDGKQKIVKAISGYREAEYKGLPQVTLYESKSGRELASYGAFSGVTIK